MGMFFLGMQQLDSIPSLALRVVYRVSKEFRELLVPLVSKELLV
jgi:hypothetical protein